MESPLIWCFLIYVYMFKGMDIMEQSKIDRINELARKARTVGLTKEEEAERAVLRGEYISSYRESLISHLDKVYIADENGEKRKLKMKDTEN